MPRPDVPGLLAQCDFMPLLRPNQRYAEAGFPTKVVESLAVGVPVVANLTGDLGEYLLDGENAFVAENWSVEAFVGAARRAWAARDRWSAMRDAARGTAQRSFDYRAHAENLGRFVEGS
jgi:glycosyltransferase involved in cell wall biosynthesis